MSSEIICHPKVFIKGDDIIFYIDKPYYFYAKEARKWGRMLIRAAKLLRNPLLDYYPDPFPSRDWAKRLEKT